MNALVAFAIGFVSFPLSFIATAVVGTVVLDARAGSPIFTRRYWLGDEGW